MEQFEGKGHSKDQLKGVGIATQRETTLLWDRQTGEPLYNAGELRALYLSPGGGGGGGLGEREGGGIPSALGGALHRVVREIVRAERKELLAAQPHPFQPSLTTCPSSSPSRTHSRLARRPQRLQHPRHPSARRIDQIRHA